MVGFTVIFGALLPVFLLIFIGWFLRWRSILSEEGEGCLLRIVIYLLVPSLIAHFVIGNPLLKKPGVALEAVATGFSCVAIGSVTAYFLAPLLGIREGFIRRTFGAATGLHNFGYLSLPVAYLLVAGGIFGGEVVGVLLVVNTGIELAIWTILVMLISGRFDRAGLKRALNPPVLTLLVSLGLNFADAEDWLPEFLPATLAMLAPCAVPIGLIMTGSTFFGLRGWFNPAAGRVIASSLFLRIGLIPLVFLGLAKVLPLSEAVKSVIAIHAAMPAAVVPVALAKYYGGSTLTAIQCSVPSCLIGLVSIPIWIQFSLWWLKL